MRLVGRLFILVSKVLVAIEMHLQIVQTQIMDEWIICGFTPFSTVLKSYQDDGRMIMKGCVQKNPVYS